MSHFEMPLRDYMTQPVATILRRQSLEEADRALRQSDISALAVTADDGSLVGVVSRTDLLKAGDLEYGEALRLPELRVEAVMNPEPLSFAEQDSLVQAAKAMLKARFHRVFVTRGSELVGVLSTRDLMRAVCETGLRTPISDIATKSLVKVRSEDPLALAFDRLDRSNKQGLVVVHEQWPIGFFSQNEALLARARDPRTPVEDVMDPRIVALPGQIPLARAAGQALSLGVRRILIMGDAGEGLIEGIVSGLDFARVMK